MLRLCRAVAVAAALLPAIAFSGQPLAQAGQDIPVAVVNGAKVMRSDVLRAYQSLPENARQQGLEAIYPRLLERMIQQELLVTAGRKAKVADEAAVKERLKEVEDAIVAEVYLGKLVEQSISPDYLKSQYAAFLEQNPATEQVHARHILLKTEIDAKNVIGHVAAGKKFEDAAREFSTGPSASSGGDLGFFKREDMVAPFSEAAFAMQAGEISKEPVKTRFGWHVIQVVERRKVEPPTFDELKPQLMQNAGRNVAGEVMQKLIDGAKVERFDLDGAPLAPAAAPAPAPKQ